MPGKGIAFLPPLPGSKFERDDAVEEVLIERPGDVEPVLIGGRSPVVHYVSAPGTSYAACQLAWTDALTRAGWRTWPTPLARNGADALVFAQFDSGGRDLWLRVHCTDEGQELLLADVGASRQASVLAKELQRDCKVVIHGLFFDTAKATLRPESEPALARLLQLLRDAPALSLEIGGHTDAVGQHAANVKLSEARAASVSAWLRAKGIAANRLVGRGYAARAPVADNDSDLGRARNRRVEVRDVRCKPRAEKVR